MIVRLVALLALLGPAAARAADPIVLLPATGSNLHEGHLLAATDVLRTDLESTGRYTVVRGTLPAAGQEPTPAQAGEAARAANATLAVTLHIARLGSGARVRLAAYAPDGSVRHTDELGAGTPDDLDPVLRRLAEGLAKGRPARELAQIDTVTSREADAYQKQAATNVFGVRLAYAPLLDRGGDGRVGELAGAGMFWLYDARTFLAEIAFEVLSGDRDDRLAALSLGAYYPFSRGNTSPYVGGALSQSWTGGYGDGDAGMGARATFGVLFGRLSTVQLRGEASFFTTLYTRETPTGRVRDYGPVLAVGIGF